MTESSTDKQAGWYTAHQSFPGVWSIESRGVMCYLVAGSERALLIDTGWGVGNLAALVSELAGLPLTVVITHGHVDHISGIYQFPEVWIDARDLPLVARAAEMRPRILARWKDETWPEGYSLESWMNAPAPAPRALPTGDLSYDLGGRTLQVLCTPAHTPGSLCLLDAEAGLLFTGDSITSSVLLQLPDSGTVRDYARSLQVMRDHREKIKYIMSGHSSDPLPAAYLDELASTADDIISGKLTGTPEQSYFGECLVARHGEAVINYKAERV